MSTRGRRPSGSNTREAILAAAKHQFAELGYPQLETVSWMGLWVTPGVPAAVQARLRDAALAVIAQRAQHDRALVCRLSRDDPAHDRHLSLLIIGRAVLRAAKQHIAGPSALNSGKEASVRIQEGDGHTCLGAGGHQSRRRAGSSEAYHTVEHVQGRTSSFGAVHLDSSGRAR